MEKIELTQGFFALVDEEDYEKLNKYKWHIRRCGNMIYAVTAIYIKGGNGKKKTIQMHRMVMGDSEKVVDHRNGNGMDNRKSNLRFCTQRQNQQNRYFKKGNSKYKGVYWDKQLNKFRTRIRVDGKLIHLGCFTNEIEAAKKYDEAAHKHFGEYAKTNFEIIGAK